VTVVQDLEPFEGQHCETVATGNLLRSAGLELSEPMMYGLGQGLSFGVFTFKRVPNPIIGGRTRPHAITETLAKHLDLDVEYRETRSEKRAWDNIAGFIDRGIPVGVQINCRYLDYFSSSIDFAGHFVAAYGYDDDEVLVVDTIQQGGAQATSRDRFAEGRLWRGPMAANAKTWTISCPNNEVDWRRVIPAAIRSNVEDYLNPPIRNFGAAGIRKTASLIEAWPETYSAANIAQVGALMERGGTGGGLFRNLYRDFIAEASALIDDEPLADTVERFDEISELWTTISAHLESVPTNGFDRLKDAKDDLLRAADLEEALMSDLRSIVR